MLPTQNKPSHRSNMGSKKNTSLNFGNAYTFGKVTSRICENYEKVFNEGSTSKRIIYVSKKKDLKDTEPIPPTVRGFMKNYREYSTFGEESRLNAGFQGSCIINIMSQFDCKNNSAEIVKPPDNTIITPNVVHIQFRDFYTHPYLQRRIQCSSEQKKRPRKITRGTQTLFRESSMQTLPYLPDVSNDKESLKTMEIFQLPKILKGDGPPGLSEVEILERARKRWAFEKIIKEKFECAMKAARSEIARKKQMSEHKTILEAFEWEHWLEREERIQSCQMLRFQLVLCIFEKREREMHNKSNDRLKKSCEKIIQKRDQALKKNEIEFGREMRRLKIKHEKKPRNWRKEKISDDLSDPASEYYGPQMRYGVNPNRRHFQLSRKAFEIRMEDLEKRAVNMKNLECPFAKLKEWSKPKQQIPEVEQNFCTDTNLQKLYEGLKGLREKSKKQKIIPKCLVEKTLKETSKEEDLEEEYVIEDLDITYTDQYITDTDEEVQVGSSYSQNSLLEMFSHQSHNLSVAEMLYERRREELESMLAEYEGTSIGWLMRFLSEEMSRLQEQRKLHFVTMLAQKERWRREAAEAGLRQKENEMRKIYEKIFNETNKANVEVCEQYLDNIFGIDTQEQADYEAITNITELARTIDVDLQRWLSSFETIQNPLNYDNLRCLLRDLVFPDSIAECLTKKYEMESIIDYIINDVIFGKVYEQLEPIEVAGVLANNLVDRLIDNDLYIFSSECSSGCDCSNVCECKPPDLEAKAIIRKLIRHSVPGRRWRTSTERVADEAVNDIVDDICGTAETARRCIFSKDIKGQRLTVNKLHSVVNLHPPRYIDHCEVGNTTTETDSSYIDTITVINYRKAKENNDSVTMSLTRNQEQLLFQETDGTSGSHLVRVKDLSVAGSKVESLTQPSFLKKAISTFDITMPLVVKEGNNITSDETIDSDPEKVVILNGTPTESKHKLQKVTQDFLISIIDEVVKSFVPNDDEISVISNPVSTIVDRMFMGGWSDDEIFVGKSDTETKNEDQHENDTDRGSDQRDTGTIESSDEPIHVEAVKKQSDYQMVMYACELKKILTDDPDECKCQMEIDYRNHIRELYESGKIKLILKQKSPIIDKIEKSVSSNENEKILSEQEVSPMDLTFQYSSSDEALVVDFPAQEAAQLKDGEQADEPKESEDIQPPIPVVSLEETAEPKNEEEQIEVTEISREPKYDQSQENELAADISQIKEHISTTAEEQPLESLKETAENENEVIISAAPTELMPELATEQFVEEPLEESQLN